MTREKRIIKTSVIGILGNILLVVGKIIVGVIAASISIITDAVNNLTDALSSIVTIIGTKLSNKKPDKQHPYGHGRVEFVTSALIGMIIFIAGALAIYESIVSLVNKDEPVYSVYSFIIISLAILIKIFLGLYFRYQSKKADSSVLKASGLDALLDAILSFGTLIGAIVSYFSGVHLEGYIGIAIGLFIIKTSIDVFRESVSKIIGERSDSSFVSQMLADINDLDGVYGAYDLILNSYGADLNIGSVHIEVDDDMKAKEIQKIERNIAYICYTKYHTIMTVGVYAKNDESDEAKEIKDKVFSIVKKYPDVIQTHGFYLDLSSKTLSFDIIIPFECRDPNEVYCSVVKEVSEAFPDYNVQIVLDKDFTLS